MSELHNSTATRASEGDNLSEYDPLQRHLPAFQHGGIRICGHPVREAGLEMLVEIQDPPGVPSIMYPLGSYEKVAEFRRVLSYTFDSDLGQDWDGQFFYAFRQGDRIYWRGHPHGITICVPTEQWKHIRALFGEAFAVPEYARLWIRLTAARGGN